MEESPVSQTQLERQTRRKTTIAGVTAGVLYGIVARAQFWLADSPGGSVVEGLFEVMSIGFIFGVPLSVGFVAVYVAGIRSFWRALIFPQTSAFLALGASLLLAWEGLICIWLWLPLFCLLTAVGGLFGAGALRLPSPVGRRSSLGLALLLPYGGMAVEQQIDLPLEVREVSTFIDIPASSDIVWEQIVEVPAISEAEHSFSLSHFIGFPRPVAAVSNGRGVGSVREASFERGVVFVEKVTRFERGRLLSFTIHTNPDSIPARALDEHVTVGGPYFDVLDGTYRIEQRAGGVRLHLSSQHRLSTRFNAYSALWTDFIMRDTQEYILRIVAERSLLAASPPS